MARRGYTGSFMCAEEGCRERGLFEYGTRREQSDHYRRLQDRPWRCVRHNQAGIVLSPDEPVKEAVLEIYETDFGTNPDSLSYKLHRFWTEPENVAEKKGGNGFKHGPGFKAFADDFPVGTRLIVTARVVLPDAAASPRKDDDR